MGWPAVAAGENVLIFAPTGSGKTLAAFLQCLNWLYREVERGRSIDGGVRVLYISPLKALNNDIHRNLEIPLDGITRTARAMDLALPKLTAAVRTGDTSASERRRIVSKPPHILITTPESLFLMVSSKQQQILTTIRYVIVDEIHSLFPSKRGTHLSLSLEYLEELTKEPFQRIGLSATLRPVGKVAEFLGGGRMDGGRWVPRPVRIIDTGARKELDLKIELPAASLSNLPEKTVWPSIYRYLLAQINSHKSTLVFVNSRKTAETTAAQLNTLAGHELARVHHGSLSRQVREEVESMLKSGQLRCLVATSSLELGIDVGSIDLVIQVESPHQVARGLQRVGRAGHVVGLPSKGRIVVKTHDDLLESAVIAEQMKQAIVEPAQTPANCLDVLAQQVVGMTAVSPMSEKHLFDVVRRAAGYRTLPKSSFERVLSMLSGQFGADEFTDLRPRIYWDRVNGMVYASEGGKRLVYTNGGTIPDRGYYGVYEAGSDVRLGELEEEFVYERRVGDRFVLGTSVWRIEEIGRDRVIVSPAGGSPTVPFWKGEGFGRSYDLGVVFGDFLARVEEIMEKNSRGTLVRWLQDHCCLDLLGARSLAAYLYQQRAATGMLPTSKRILVEEFTDELGQWRVVVHSPFGKRVNRPLALLLGQQLRERSNLEIVSVELDDGIMFMGPAGPEPPFVDPAEIGLAGVEETLMGLVGKTPLFGSLFRENAARALILPKQGYGKKRTPLWLARLKAADLLQVVSKYPDFPIVTETYRQILDEAFDLRGTKEVLRKLGTGEINVIRCRRSSPSPFAQPMMFSMLAEFMYSPDLPRQEQRLSLLGVNRDTLKELLDEADLRELLDPKAVQEVIHEAERAFSRTPWQSDNQLHAWLLRRGDWLVGPDGRMEAISGLSVDELGLLDMIERLESAGRVRRVTWRLGQTSQRALVPTELVNEYLSALPEASAVGFNPTSAGESLNAVEATIRILRRFAAVRGPFTTQEAAARYGLPISQVEDLLKQLQERGILQSGEFLPGGQGTEWCDIQVLRRIYRRSLARVRRSVKPCSKRDYAAFLLRWQGLDPVQPASTKTLSDVLAQLSGLFLPGLLWERFTLPARVEKYSPAEMDRLMASGLFFWQANGEPGDFKVAVEQVGLEMMRQDALLDVDTAPVKDRDIEEDDGAEPGVRGQVLGLLSKSGALSIPQIWQMTGIPISQLLVVLEDLMLQGLLTNDSFGPIRYFLAGNPFRANRSKRPQVVPPAVLAQMGRWSIVPSTSRCGVGEGQGKTGANESARDAEVLCTRLLNVYGIASRETAAAAGLEWRMVSHTLAHWEMIGKVRRGYFVEGLSGVQYASSEAVELLRTVSDQGCSRCFALPAADPANAWGSILPWPGSRRPRDSSVLVIDKGEPLLVAEGSRITSVQPTLPFKEDILLPALMSLVRVLVSLGNPGQRIELLEFDGVPIEDTLAGSLLVKLGFEQSYKGLVKWVH